MEKEFIPYEQALELKELGFDEQCLGYYHVTLGSNDVDLVITKTPDRFYHLIRIPEHFDTLTPLYQQAFRWFREKYGLYSMIDVDQTMEPKFCYTLSRYKGDFQWDNILPTYSELYYTYEEAELACLKKLIEIVK